VIRGGKIMLDRDLAELYEVETRALNQAVSRNMERFPEEFEILKSQNELFRMTVEERGDYQFAGAKGSITLSTKEEAVSL
jgi:hypothetical protein